MKTRLFLFTISFVIYSGLSAQANYIGSGISLSVNGDNGNYVDLGDVFNDLNFPFTIEAWVYPTAWTAFGDYAPIISTDNASTGSYYGLWFRFNSSGKLILEIGDGSGAGSTDRRGKVTSGSISLNQWTHVAVVATSVTDMQFYFNGVLQTASNTDGGASNTSLVHNSNPATISRQVTPFAEHNFIGQLDEIRLWNTGKTETDIRTHMCSKISTLPGDLIGYWNFDESYDSETVTDITTPTENGTITGSADKITSGAPIGDESTYKYLEDWTGVKMTIYALNDDFFRIKEIINNPHGMHIYRVDNSPYYNDGLLTEPGYYFGVFPVNDGTPASYGISYRFTASNGISTAENADFTTLYTKETNAISSWMNLGGIIDDAYKFIRKPGNITRMEVILNINNPAINNNDGNNKNADNDLYTSVFPNPANDYVYITDVRADEQIYLVNAQGQFIKTDYTITDQICRIDLTGITKGIYFIYGVKVNGCIAKIQVL